MNCKQGDLAILVAYDEITAPHAGRVVRCVRLSYSLSHPDWPGWEIEPRIGKYKYAADAALRPIRPGDISDEEVRDLYAPKVPEVA